MLSDVELQRYQKQIQLPNIGIEGQEKFKRSSVLVIGLGGLGCAITPYLCAAGVGHIGLMDFDDIARSNLARQVLYQDKDIKRSKAIIAQQQLKKINPHIKVEIYQQAFTLEQISILDAYDLIIDATDRFQARNDISLACVKKKKACLYAAVSAEMGQCALFLPQEACYRCTFPKLPQAGIIQNCAQDGILGPAVGMLGTMQALLALQYLSQQSPPAMLHCIDFQTFRNYQIPLVKNPRCLQCSTQHHEITSSNSFKIHYYTASQLANSMTTKEYVMIDVRESDEYVDDCIRGAVSFPLSQWKVMSSREILNALQKYQADHADVTCSFLLYCEQGVRSEKAIEILNEKLLVEDEDIRLSGLFYHLNGGIQAWHEYQSAL